MSLCLVSKINNTFIKHGLRPTGHMIYEMCTGRELKGVFPSKSELESVRNGECKEALRFIFERNNDESVIHTIEQVRGTQKEHEKMVMYFPT